MKIILVGATGTIGRHLDTELSKRHEVIRASHSKGEVKVDITSRASIEQMFKQIGSFDALISVAGGGYFGPLYQMTEENLYQGIRSKMLGQINLVMVGKDYVNDNGSFTLTSGILAEDPIRNGAALSMINSAVQGFVIGAAVEMQKGVRINVVSPGLVEDSHGAMGAAFPGHVPVAMPRVVQAYLKSAEGAINGQVIRVF